MDIEFSIGYKTNVPLQRIDNEADFLAYRKKNIDQINDMNKKIASSNVKSTKKKKPVTLESLMTSMEPTELRVHLDSGFDSRTYHTFQNYHRQSLTYSKSVNTKIKHKLVGTPVNGIVDIDSQIVVFATNKTLNQYGVLCNEDAGVGYIRLNDVLEAAGVVSNKIDSTQSDELKVETPKSISLTSPLLIDNIPLHYRFRDTPIIKGNVNLIVHKINFNDGIKISRSIHPTHNVPENIPTLKSIVNNYMGEFVSEIGSFIPLAKDAGQLNCPLYPSENTFVGASAEEALNLPMPTYLRSDCLIVNQSFWITKLRILIDRKYPTRPYRQVEENPKEEMNEEEEEEEEESMISLDTPELSKLMNRNLIDFFRYYMQQPTKGRARWLAKFLVLYIQTLDYESDTTFDAEKKKKVPTEMFSEILVMLTGDCEDLAKGLVRLYNTFVDTAPHLGLLLRSLQSFVKDDSESTLFDEKIRMLLQKHLPDNEEDNDIDYLKVIQAYHVDVEFWSDLSSHVFQNIETYSAKLDSITKTITVPLLKNTKDDSDVQVVIDKNVRDESFDYFGGNLESLIFAIILRDFHKIACHYIDTFTLFGVRNTHIQNVPGDKHKKDQTPPPPPKKRSREEQTTEPEGGGHAAVILWPSDFFEKAISRWDKNHALAAETTYSKWMIDHGYDPSDDTRKTLFPQFNKNKLEPLILEGTGMLEPSSRKDSFPKSRKMMNSLSFFSAAKKEVNPDHFDSPFYQSVMLAVSSRFMDSHRIATFNVTERIKPNVNMDSLIGKGLINGMLANKELLGRITGNGGAQINSNMFNNNNSVTKREFIQSYMSDHLVGDDMYAKGTPFSNVMSQNEDVILVPFGFTKGLIRNKLVETKTNLAAQMSMLESTNSRIESHILNFANPENDKQIQHVAGYLYGFDNNKNKNESKKSVKSFMSDIGQKINFIQKNFILEDGNSVCEFDPISLDLIDNVAKQSIMVPPITSSMVVSAPVQNYLEFKRMGNKNPYSKLNPLVEAYPFSKSESGMRKLQKDIENGSIIRYSAFIKPEQLSSREAIKGLMKNIELTYPKGFLKHLDYNVEKYTNDNNSIRIDFYVKNME